MTLSRETSTVLRGADLERLPVASLIAASAPPVPRSANAHGGSTDGVALGQPDPVEDDASADQLVSEAYEAGFAEGVGAAEAALLSTVADALDALERAAGQHEAARLAWTEVGPAEALDLAFQLCELILQREVCSSDDAGRDAILRCFAELQPRERAVIRLHPDDLESLGDIDDLLTNRTIELVPDASLERGDAVADIAHGSIDARLGSALERVREELTS